MSKQKYLISERNRFSFKNFALRFFIAVLFLSPSIVSADVLAQQLTGVANTLGADFIVQTLDVSVFAGATVDSVMIQNRSLGTWGGSFADPRHTVQIMYEQISGWTVIDSSVSSGSVGYVQYETFFFATPVFIPTDVINVQIRTQTAGGVTNNFRGSDTDTYPNGACVSNCGTVQDLQFSIRGDIAGGSASSSVIIVPIIENMNATTTCLINATSSLCTSTGIDYTLLLGLGILIALITTFIVKRII